MNYLLILDQSNNNNNNNNNMNNNNENEENNQGRKTTSIEDRFTVLNEFSGLKGVLPIDAAVFDNQNLLAFIEIDGESHYKQFNQKLRRKDKLKEFLYKYYYPSVPLFRIRSDQVIFLIF